MLGYHVSFTVSAVICSGLEALKERFLRHVQPAPRSKGERSLHVDVVRKDSTASGQEELHVESITVTVNNEEEEPTHTKPGLLSRIYHIDICCWYSLPVKRKLMFFSFIPINTPVEYADVPQARTACLNCILRKAYVSF